MCCLSFIEYLCSIKRRMGVRGYGFHRKRAVSNLEDGVLWKETKDGIFMLRFSIELWRLEMQFHPQLKWGLFFV